jgi:hypothetical protein
MVADVLGAKFFCLFMILRELLSNQCWNF